ncbi:hypothetical protein D3D01_18895 [Haloarcula sp. Atlit-7R]|nr:hypothetical protein D3D01_18895 [Haloarcula sp. Atlit-7R]
MLLQGACHHPAFQTVLEELFVMMRFWKRIREQQQGLQRAISWLNSTTSGSSGLPVLFNASTQYS